MFSRKKLNLFVILLVGFGMPAYYKIKFMILGLITMEDILNWLLPVEVLFGLLLASGVVFGHDLIVTSLRRHFQKETDNRLRFAIQYLISTLTSVLIAIGFSIIFWDYIMKMPITAEFIFDYALLGLVIPLLVNGVSESLFFYGRWEKESAEKERLAKENIKAKYEVLQNQVDPHFLFNCFNTLGVLIKESKKAASEFLQQLSSVYRYVLDIKNVELVSLKMETDSLMSYSSLMKHRFGNSFKLALDFNKNDNFYLAPLTLQMLMENALKHNQFSNQAPLDIQISVKEDYLAFSNKLRKPKSEAQGTKTGLKNLSDRYHILSGKNIQIHQSSDDFEVKIPLIEIEDI